MNFLKKIFNKNKNETSSLKNQEESNSIKKIESNYLFEKHSIEVVKKWVNNLDYGFYKRAWGGHANDGDEFGIWLKYKDKTELFEILKVFKIELKVIPKDYPKAIPGKSYSWEEYEKFKNEIKDYPEFEQPSHIEIDKTPCFCWIGKGKFSLTFSGAKDGNKYEISEQDFLNCKYIVNIIKNNKLDKYINKDYEKLSTHISKSVYPELFE